MKIQQTLNLYPYNIYQYLLLKLRERFNVLEYNIPSKKNIYSDIRAARNSMKFNTFYSVINPPACYKKNGRSFFQVTVDVSHPRSIPNYINMDKKRIYCSIEI
ncbi:hypothetical protein HZS_6702 [Henneguya salminicola]|nr:hypothetical protein HZS_6702 [Henneguya salminicola]